MPIEGVNNRCLIEHAPLRRIRQLCRRLRRHRVDKGRGVTREDDPPAGFDELLQQFKRRTADCLRAGHEYRRVGHGAQR